MQNWQSAAGVNCTNYLVKDLCKQWIPYVCLGQDENPYVYCESYACVRWKTDRPSTGFLYRADRRKSTESQKVVAGPSRVPPDKKERSTLSSERTLTEEQLQEYRNVFENFDENGDGTISADELTVIIRSLGYDYTEEHIEHLIKDVDIDENRVLDFSEFIQLMQHHVRPMNSEELIYEAFKQIGGDGTITVDTLREKAQALGLNFSDQDLRDMIEQAAPDNEGKISYQGLIGFMSEGNDTLWDAYERRVKVEEVHKEKAEQRRLEVEREEALRVEAPERVPDIEEIASQFDNSTYDEFSRQPNSRRLVKRPGKKVPMTRTRMQYLKRKAEAQGLDVDELAELRDFHDTQHSHLRKSESSKDLWMGSINDDKMFDTHFKSNPPKAYKHVESRLHIPTQRHGKHTGSLKDRNVDRKQKLVLQTAVVTDFDKELKKIQQSREGRQKTKSNSSNMFPMKAAYKRYVINTEKLNVKVTEGYLENKKQKDAYNLNYNMWKTFFEKAVKQINEAKKKIDIIETALNDVQDDKNKKKDTNYTNEFSKKRSERQNLRPNVITPTLNHPSQKQVKVDVHKSTDRKPLKPSNLLHDSTASVRTKSESSAKQKKDQGSYVNRFREARGISVHDSTDFSVSTLTSKKSWKPLKNTVPVITKQSLEHYW